ncbi:NAD(P)H nitroreductase [Alteromonas aestuariivivens]|uniref:Putative NAD(P)H nitroreductase n=1 Tax=Alteromonas aestuariivivens TaxID=1938339 RepID=A0A3D8M8M9_9ALTE|nr:NAD(P)H nitroreductase [Alteromonas aestuariivivens]RDV26159.1 NAD(P)H nitroreductase [Alteromonas aestuariivivens]
MDALTLLLNRHSQPRLTEPAPSGSCLENIMQAALRVPDHAGLKPWRFVVCEGMGRHRLGSLFEQSAVANDKSAKEVERAAQLPMRAPMVIVAIARYTEHAKVPWVEQVASASCAVMAMQMAAFAQGFQGIWRTGDYAHCDTVKTGLGLQPQDEIVGYLYLGTAVTEAPAKPPVDAGMYFANWRSVFED